MSYSIARAAASARIRWSVGDTRTFQVAPLHMGPRVAHTIHRVSGIEIIEETPCRWRASAVRPMSLYNECEIVATVTAAEEDLWSKVDVRVEFESNNNRVIAFLWMTLSGVGVPIVYGWRALSIRSSRDFARGLFDRFWGALLAHDDTVDQPYRSRSK